MLPSNFKSWRCEHMSSSSSSNAQSVSTHVKHNSKALSRKRESHVEPSVPVRGHFEVDPTTPETVAHTRTYFFPRPKLRLPEKTQCFVQILTFKSHPWCIKTKLSCNASVKVQELMIRKRSFRAMLPWNSKSWRCESEAFVRCFIEIPRVEDSKRGLRQIPRVEDVKPKLSPLLSSTFLYSILCSTLLCSSLPCSALLCFALLYSTLLYATLPYSTLLYYTLLFSPLLYSKCQPDTMIFVLWW